MRFSIIIPAYNVGTYIAEALHFVSDQSCRDWECICINDGSSDGTVGILDVFSSRDHRFKVIQKSCSAGKTKIYWRYSRSTRFGNWLFQYGVAKTLAKGGDVAFYVDPSFDEQHADGLRKCAEVMRGLQIVREVPKGAEIHDGVPQAVGLLDEPMIRELYRVPPRIDAFIRSTYSVILSASLKVSIHVRRGDYLRFPHRHPFVGKAYLRQAVGLFPSEALFVVCSDDMSWCKKFFVEKNFPGRRFAFVEGGGALSDLYMATCCDHNVMSNSTFSWWGAFLNTNPGKRVIMPSHWYGMAFGQNASALVIRDLSYHGVEVVENRYDFATFIKAGLLFAKGWCGDIVRSLRARRF